RNPSPGTNSAFFWFLFHHSGVPGCAAVRERSDEKPSLVRLGRPAQPPAARDKPIPNKTAIRRRQAIETFFTDTQLDLGTSPFGHRRQGSSQASHLGQERFFQTRGGDYGTDPPSVKSNAPERTIYEIGAACQCFNGRLSGSDRSSQKPSRLS